MSEATISPKSPSACPNIPLEAHETSTVLPPVVPLDSPSPKHITDIRIVSQKFRGAIYNYKKQRYHYIPRMESFYDLGAYFVLLLEKNVYWRVHDNQHYNHLLNWNIWKPVPVKTSVASCNWKNYSRTTYQLGGNLTLLANYITSKVYHTESYPLGLWIRTKIRLN